MRATSDGIRSAGYYEPPIDTTLTYDPPLRIPNDLYPGEVLPLSSTLYANGDVVGDMSGTLEFVGLEDVAVPAGLFDNCMKLEGHVYSARADGEHDDHYYAWYAWGIRIVKMDYRPFGGEDWRELVSATIAGVRYPAEGWDITDYFPLGEGDTWTWEHFCSLFW